MLGPLDFRKRAAGLYNADHKEQHKQCVAYGFQRSVYAQNNAPYPAALEVLWRLGDYLPYLLQFIVPNVKRVNYVVYYPVAAVHLPCSRQPVIRFRISLANVIMIPPANVRNPLARWLGSWLLRLRPI